MKKIIEIEIGLPKSIVQYEGEPITTMISTEQLQEELNLQLLQPDVISSFSNLDEAAQRYSDDWENITGLEYEDEYPEAINKLDFINGAKWQQKQYTIEEQHVGHTIDELDKEYIKGFNEGSAYYIERMYSEEEVKNIMAETWIKCVGNDGNNFKKLRDKILEQFKKK